VISVLMSVTGPVVALADDPPVVPGPPTCDVVLTGVVVGEAVVDVLAVIGLLVVTCTAPLVVGVTLVLVVAVCELVST
jgi:hypothetical protein